MEYFISVTVKKHNTVVTVLSQELDPVNNF
jgi:hypothetical protein